MGPVAVREATTAYEAAINRELHDFTGVVAHDLRSPLRRIVTLSDWLVRNSDRAETLESAAQQEYLLEQKESLLELRDYAATLYKFVEGILAYARAGGIVDETSSVSEATAVVATLLDKPEGFSVHLPTQDLTVRVGKTQLIQVIQNLVVNAIQHHPKKDGNVWIDCCQAGRNVLIYVEDDGKGIAPQYRALVFEPFQKLDCSGSVGLGLSIVKKIVTAYNGSISVGNRDGGGTRFEVLLPRGA